MNRRWAMGNIWPRNSYFDLKAVLIVFMVLTNTTALIQF
jgi:hypothetical protein